MDYFGFSLGKKLKKGGGSSLFCGKHIRVKIIWSANGIGCWRGTRGGYLRGRGVTRTGMEKKKKDNVVEFTKL